MLVAGSVRQGRGVALGFSLIYSNAVCTLWTVRPSHPLFATSRIVSPPTFGEVVNFACTNLPIDCDAMSVPSTASAAFGNRRKCSR